MWPLIGSLATLVRWQEEDSRSSAALRERSKIRGVGLLWRLSGKESACPSRRNEFNPWSGKIPHATEQLNPRVTHNSWACALEPGSHNYWSPGALEPVLCSKRSHHNEKPTQHTRESPLLSATTEKPVQQWRLSISKNTFLKLYILKSQ